LKSGKSSQQVTRQVHEFTEKFSFITAMKVLLTERFGDQVPDNLDFNFEGKSKKRWLCSKEDLDVMHKSLKKNDEIVLWCESNSHVQKRKK